jgi:hypothetical protein
MNPEIILDRKIKKIKNIQDRMDYEERIKSLEYNSLVREADILAYNFKHGI